MNRIQPILSAGSFRTFQVMAPRKTHFRSATCQEVNCPRITLGWASIIDESTGLGQRQADYIRRASGRKFTEERTPEGLTRFVFAPNQECFDQHYTRDWNRPELYFVRDGDWRGNPRGTRARQHSRPEHWVEEFAENQSALADRIEKG